MAAGAAAPAAAASASVPAPASTRPSAGGAMSSTSSSPSTLVQAYLFVYNLASCVAWAYVWTSIVLHMYTQTTQRSYAHAIATLYDQTNAAMAMAQTAAVLEVVHAAIRLVRSPVSSVFVQVASRLMLVWGVTYIAPDSRHHSGYLLMSLSWSTVEIPRYLYYAWNLVGTAPYALTWLRYSLFYVLYPTGITGEISCMWLALPHIAATRMLSIELPNAFNFSFSYYYFCLFLLALYAPGSPYMIGHMIKQRTKYLQAARDDAKKKQQ